MATPAIAARAFEKFTPFSKVDEQTHSVTGIATNETVDKMNERCIYDATVPAYKKWSDEAVQSTSAAGQQRSFGNIRLQHGMEVAGKATGIDYDDPNKQIIITVQPISDEIWTQIQQGFWRGFSHSGNYAWRRCSICGTDIPGTSNWCPNCKDMVIVDYAVNNLSEVSIVDNPCLADARFLMIRADGSQEIRSFKDRDPQVVLDRVQKMAAEAAATFAEAIETLKTARKPDGTFTITASGPVHDALAAAGYEHTRTGVVGETGAEPTTPTATYSHANGTRVIVTGDSNWSYDRHGVVTTGAGVESLTAHLDTAKAAKAEGQTWMVDRADFHKQHYTREEAAAIMEREGCEISRVEETYDFWRFHYTSKGTNMEPTFTLTSISGIARNWGEAPDAFVTRAVTEVIAKSSTNTVTHGIIDVRKTGDGSFEYITQDGTVLQVADNLARFTAKAAVDPVPAKPAVVELAKTKIDSFKSVLEKSMWDVQTLAGLLQDIRWLVSNQVSEAMWEGDDDNIAFARQFHTWLTDGVGILNQLVAEETAELLEIPPALKAAFRRGEQVDMKHFDELFKGVSGFSGHFKAAHEHHTAKAAHHKSAGESHAAMADDHTKMAAHHTKMAAHHAADKVMSDHHTTKAAHHTKCAAHHTMKAAHHDGMHKTHSAMCTSCKAMCDHLAGTEKAFKALGPAAEAGDPTAIATLQTTFTDTLAAMQKSFSDGMTALTTEVVAIKTATAPEAVGEIVDKALGKSLSLNPAGTPTLVPRAGSLPNALLKGAQADTVDASAGI